MFKRLRSFLHWLWAGEGFFPEQPIPVNPVVIKVPEPTTVTARIDHITVEDNVLLWAAASLMGGNMARGAQGAADAARFAVALDREIKKALAENPNS